MDIFIAAFAVLVATSAGAALILFFGCMDGKRNAAMLAFAAGAMAFSSIEMLSESHKATDEMTMLAGLGLGILALMLSEKTLPHIHHHMTKRELEQSGKKIVLVGGAIAIHNIPEGLAIATAFASSGPLGWFVTATLALQDIPEGMLIAAPLACYGMKKGKAVFFGMLSGAAEAAAAVLGFHFIMGIAPLVPLALAFSAGAMGYVVMVELLPDAFSRGNERLAAICFIAGAALSFGIAAVLSV